MSQFLRDEYLRNLTITEDCLKRINDDLEEIIKKQNETLNLQFTGQDLIDRLLMHSYIIRFDGKGFRLFDFESAIKYFQDAKRVERFIIVVDSIKSINRIHGQSIDLRLDAMDINNCSIVVQDDNDTWVGATFSRLKERLDKYHNKNYMLQNKFTPFILQMVGVIVGFFISFWIASAVSPKLNIDNPFAVSFIILFIIFSNCWVWMFDLSKRIINYLWPNIEFKKRGEIPWPLKGIINSVIALFVLYIFGIMLSKVLIFVKLILK